MSKSVNEEVRYAGEQAKGAAGAEERSLVSMKRGRWATHREALMAQAATINLRT